MLSGFYKRLALPAPKSNTRANFREECGAVDPKILLLDEPFSALDFQTKLKLEDLVFDTLKQFHKTAVLVTHDIGEAIAMSDRILLLASKPGRLYKIFDVPTELRRLRPFEARSQKIYSELFNDIWKELESLENS